MNTLFDPKQGGSTKSFIATLLSTIAMFAISATTLLVVTLSENTSAITDLVPVSSQGSVVSNSDGVDYDHLVLFSSSFLNGPLPAPSLNGPLK